MCCEETHGIHGKIKERRCRNGKQQNKGEGQLPDMVVRTWGRSQTDPLGFFQGENISYSFGREELMS